MPERAKADGDYPVAKEREIRMLNLLLSAVETPSRFVLSYELYDFVHSRVIRKPSKILRYASKPELPPFYFFVCKN
ncbi:hypothetical protein BXY57_0415 [Thermoflavifilum aggregans]|uniref:Uncharacterized protein n=1 Tax=Thermoflavifilum aggregans TaxID=454188 RepID=A0A2M9CSM6_9BACT|nr:hypothetical protein BXY57_0415 [Thermoflavifilum aggregans]